MQKTVVVTVSYLRKLPKYHVWRKFQSRIMAHDELNECRVGDLVQISSCRPLSKRKAFKVTQLLDRAEQYDQDTKEEVNRKAEIEERKALDRRMEMHNELMSRRQFMEEEAIAIAKKEIEEMAPYLERMQQMRKAMYATAFTDPPIVEEGEEETAPITHLSSLESVEDDDAEGGSEEKEVPEEAGTDDKES